jgi:hypothetical protein
LLSKIDEKCFRHDKKKHFYIARLKQGKNNP